MEKGAEEKDENLRIREFIELDKTTLPADGGPRFNRLIFAKSPYLLQHADNPVDWHPWGEEAFAKARRENKLVFLSVGYATCHWCHVMAHESFADPEVAEVVNRYTVPIKVDREERPDIDSRYMLAAQMMTSRGGWPLNVIMTPDRKPFFAATYLPKRSERGMPGLIEVLGKLYEAWQTRGELVLKDCDAVLDALRRISLPAPGPLPVEDLLQVTYRELAGTYDPFFGGFGDPPKFPMCITLSFLVLAWKNAGFAAAREMVEKTLRRIRGGGIWDQIGSGIHRYSVDREWLVPHFEKMLYDQALLAVASIDAYQAFADPFHLTVAEELFEYVLREMTAPAGGFYSGQDADTEGEEGRFYFWTPVQVEEVLGAETARIFCQVYDVTEQGNFEKRNILHLKRPLAQFIEASGMERDALTALLEDARKKLLSKREERVRPFRDEKILTGWNGLMIVALARGAGITGNERYLAAAVKAAAFLEGHLSDSSGRLQRSYHLGGSSIPAFLEDYAILAWGLTELYRVTADASYLDGALRCTSEMLRIFGNGTGGGLYDTGSDAEEVLMRMKRSFDDVTPSGNSVAAMNLLRLGRITSDDNLVREGEGILRAFMATAAGQPSWFLHLLCAWDFFRSQGTEITLVYREKSEEFHAMLRAVHRRYIPDLTLRFVREGEESKGLKTVKGKPTAHICAGGACLPPAAGVKGLEKALEGVL
ncbi:MAG TPA: thioredoxin domain-containing protein [Geobacteraceae bacterium]|nr:thioredoxin domain-containing protein [Geobacteraceae bacterium]